MNARTALEFIKRLYDRPEGHSFTRLEHEALRVAIIALEDACSAEKKGNSNTRISKFPSVKTHEN